MYSDREGRSTTTDEEWDTCPKCGVHLKKKNLPRHMTKVHSHSLVKPYSRGDDLSIKRFRPLITLCVILLIIFGSVAAVIYHRYIENEKEDIDDILIQTDDTCDGFEERVETINQNALEWLDTLNVDPIRLRDEMGIKGKKKLVELLDIYLCLYMTTESLEKRIYYRDMAANATKITHTPEYHDMEIIDDDQFKQDSTSYLRACYIIDKFGLDTSYYIENIKKVLPRLDSFLPQRGTNQKMAFVLYYHHLGFHIDYSMEELFINSVIRSRRSIETLSDIEGYFITHEIFSLYNDNSMYIMKNNDTEYLQEILLGLMDKYMKKNNVDLSAELLMVLTYLKFNNSQIYDVALDFLLDSQNANGSFGDYEYEREYCKKEGLLTDVDYLLYLHTTEVTLIAINEALR